MLMRSLLAFIALPGIFALLTPPLIAFVDPWSSGPWFPGFLLMSLGTFVLLWCIRDFYASGRGTLAPWDPPDCLVVIGLYRYTRNPMYVGVVLLVLGWALFYLSPLLLLYFAILAVYFHLRVIHNEEPWLVAQFGDHWERYRQNVPRWRPRLLPYHQDINDERQ